MAIIDKIFRLSAAQAITASAASTDYADLGAADLNLEQGTPLYANCLLVVAPTTSANTLTINLGNDANTPPTTKVQELMPATAESAILTTQVLFSVPIGSILGSISGRYLNFLYVVSTTLNSPTVTSYIGSHNLAT